MLVCVFKANGEARECPPGRHTTPFKRNSQQQMGSVGLSLSISHPLMRTSCFGRFFLWANASASIVEGGGKKHREVWEIDNRDDDLEVNFFTLISYKFEQCI